MLMKYGRQYTESIFIQKHFYWSTLESASSNSFQKMSVLFHISIINEREVADFEKSL